MKYNADEVLQQLGCKGIYLRKQDNTIIIPESPHGPIGNKTYGKLDFLVNYCGYHVIDERYKNIHDPNPSNYTRSIAYGPRQNSFNNPGRKYKRAKRQLEYRMNNYNSATSNKHSGQLYHAPGSMQM